MRADLEPQSEFIGCLKELTQAIRVLSTKIEELQRDRDSGKQMAKQLKQTLSSIHSDTKEFQLKALSLNRQILSVLKEATNRKEINMEQYIKQQKKEGNENKEEDHSYLTVQKQPKNQFNKQKKESSFKNVLPQPQAKLALFQNEGQSIRQKQMKDLLIDFSSFFKKAISEPANFQTSNLSMDRAIYLFSQQILRKYISLIRQKKVDHGFFSALDLHLRKQVLPIVKVNFIRVHPKQVQNNQKFFLEKDILHQKRFDMIQKSPVKCMSWFHKKEPLKNDKDDQTIKQAMRLINFLVQVPNKKLGPERTLEEQFAKDVENLYQVFENQQILAFLQQSSQLYSKFQISARKQETQAKGMVGLGEQIENFNHFLMKFNFQEKIGSLRDATLKQKPSFIIERKLPVDAAMYTEENILHGDMPLHPSIRQIIEDWIKQMRQFLSDNSTRQIYGKDELFGLPSGGEFLNQLTLTRKTIAERRYQYILDRQMSEAQKKTRTLLLDAIRSMQSFEDQKIAFLTLSKLSDFQIVICLKNTLNRLKQIERDCKKSLCFDKNFTQDEKNPILIRLNVTDLLKSQICLNKHQMIVFYRYIQLFCQRNPQIFEVGRIQNSLISEGQIVFNIWYRKEIMIELKLKQKQRQQRFNKLSSWLKLIRKLEDSILSPIYQLASIWKKQVPYSKFLSQKSVKLLELTPALVPSNCDHQFQEQKTERFPFFCFLCKKTNRLIQTRFICTLCKLVKCVYCKNLAELRIAYPLQKEQQEIEEKFQYPLENFLGEGSVLIGINLISKEPFNLFMASIMGKKQAFRFRFRRQGNVIQYSDISLLSIQPFADFQRMLSEHYFYRRNPNDFTYIEKNLLLTEVMKIFWGSELEGKAKRKSKTLAIHIISQPSLGKENKRQLSQHIITTASNFGFCDRIQNFVCPELQIHSLKIVQSFVNLRKLSLRKNMISNFSSFSNLNFLEELNVSSNRITSFQGIPSLPNIKTFDFSQNQFESFNFFPVFEKLETLLGSNNRIRGFSQFPFLGNLQYLNLRKNEIEGFAQMPNLPKLLTLIISENKLKDFLHFPLVVTLQCLMLNTNQIRSLRGITQLSNLVIFQLQQNLITSFEGLTQMESLKQLNMKRNKLQNFFHLPNFPNLKTLDCSFNKIKGFESFPLLQNLEKLNIEENKIEKWNDFRILPGLKQIRVRGNWFSQFNGFPQNPNLVIFSGFKNCFTKFEHLPVLSRVQQMWLDQNKISSFFGIPQLPNLKRLFLNKNCLRDFKYFQYFPSLQILRVEGNQIQSFVGLPSLSRLRQLSIYNNLLRNFDHFPQLGSLQVLRIFKNKIESFQGITGLPHLKTLVIRRNSIASFDFLPDLPKLEQFDIYDNPLKSFDNFPILPKLKVLNAMGNDCLLTTLQVFQDCHQIKKIQINRYSVDFLETHGLLNGIGFQVSHRPESGPL